MTREPYLVVRDLRVWFGKRRGFLASIRKTEPQYVRAVDGIDLDIAKGELYCLVGESGCGKTTTGKGILHLVRPTGGDIFVGAPQEALRAYAQAQAEGREEPLEEIRRRWSLSYREKVAWKPKDIAIFLAMALLGMIAAGGVTGALIFGLAAIGSTGWITLTYILTGVLLGLIGTLPWVKWSHRNATVLLVFAIGATDLSRLIAFGFAGYLGLWSADFAGVVLLLFQYLVAMLAVTYAAKFSTAFWESKKGIQMDKFRKLRKTLQIIFQDPYESLNPKHSVYDTVAEPLIVNHLTHNRAETEARVTQALSDAGLRPPRDFMFRYPHELSGGQRQRVSIAGALVLDPDFLVADEPVSMLDVSIRTEILETLLELRAKKALTYLFITHDLSLAWVLSDRIGVMYLGKIVEEGPKAEIVRNPRHPYTKALISVVPVPDPDRRHERVILKGERPDPSDIPPGCRFHPRCPVAFEACGWTSEELADDLRQIAAASGREPKFLGCLAVDGERSLYLAHDAPEAEAWIREQIAQRSQEYRSLRAIRSVERANGGLRILLHEGSEPTLKSVGSDARVACHLAG